MNERRGGQRVARTSGELAPSHAAELLIDQRKNLVERIAAPCAEVGQQFGNARCGTSRRYRVAKCANRVNSRGHFSSLLTSELGRCRRELSLWQPGLSV